MKKRSFENKDSAMREEYDFSHGVRGKYSEKYGESTNLVAIDPELSDAFPDSKSVNDALKALVEIAARTGSSARRPL